MIIKKMILRGIGE